MKYMNRSALNKPQNNYDAICGDLLTMAERELASFFRAVTASFGSEQAEVSAEDWLRELAAIHDLPASTREWRKLTIKASARLTRNVHISGPCHGLPLALLKPKGEAANHETTV
jgi:hypothetical protein